ncbi:S1/P1 nuclease [Sphingomonas sp. RB1R13]|uniref:S1/P1 nuclease n=1 Tax=Sphingomonas sp. RB1R13 TaxID=3096159 RepID=UPI002FC9A086
MPHQLLARIAALLLALVPALILATPASAYWEYGHQTVAKIAYAEVRATTRAKLNALLRHGALLGTPECPVSDMASASTWADCIKPLKDAAGKARFGYAYNWHFQNVDICKPFDLKTPCADGNCVSAQIIRQQARLADRSLPLADRIQALAFLTHFVGDLSQPLHAGDRHDLGGNKVTASYGVIAGRANLHMIWDGYLAERSISTPPGGVMGLIRSTPRSERRALVAGEVTDWSRDSWRVSHDSAYGAMFADPCVETKGPRPVMDEAMVQRLIPVARRQVVAGGLRLAKLLDAALR